MLGVWVFFRFVRTIIRSMGDPEFRALFGLVVALLTVGSLFYWQVEGWTLFNSLYFSVITLTTVGYGDFSPHTLLGKIFTMVYIFVGLGILLGFIETIARRSREEDAFMQPGVNRIKHRKANGKDSSGAKQAEEVDKTGG